ncbi:aminopeptidase N [Amnibacterium endophyticum]|uniref:Aminopeptidase N n=1 Tax=Amnibacterium endophyticum TaxID=2109337 RepID=A0ABW4LGM6_9MICO
MPASLTREEAAERAALLDVTRYDIDVDLTGLEDGPTWRSVSTVAFECRAPGASTFVDVVATIERAVLNGRALDPSSAAEGRLPLDGLEEHNVLVVETSQSETDRGQGVLRTVDPTDGLVYVWTTFEPDEARRLWACFDQPDLKAVHRFTALAPSAWTVTSNSAPESIEYEGDARRWTFEPTPPLSTYVAVVNAGPFHQARREAGDHDLGLYCRQSLKAFLERDADELFGLTAAGLAWFGERFDLPFPQRRYDQVFVPDLGGAMENWGSVTHTDSVLFRSEPTYRQRSSRANLVLHEMAHMWFGDLVTMRWWDDLWLNEAFASWASVWAMAGATEFTDAWATELLDGKLAGYRQDMGPATHPIRGDVPDVLHAMANFDDITYDKGAAVLHQLSAYLGEDAFVAGLRAYFAEHAWGSTVLGDLMGAFSAASGRDLEAWTTEWLDRAGTDLLVLDGGVLRATAPDGGAPRPHRLRIAGYDADGAVLRPAGETEVEVVGPETPVEAPGGTVFQVNAGDLAFAAVRADEASLETLRARAGELPDALARTLALTTTWDRLVKGELTGDAVVETVRAVVAVDGPAVVEGQLALGLQAAELWTPIERVPAAVARLADAAAALVDRPEHRLPALRMLATAGTRPEHLAAVDEAAGDDVDLAWRVLARRAELGAYDEAAARALKERDPDPDSGASALAALGSQPDRAAKEVVWQALMIDRSIPAGPARRLVAQRFWRPLQGGLLAEFADRYLDVLASLGDAGMLGQLGLVRAMFPYAVLDDRFLARAEEAAQADGVNPTVRTTLLDGVATGRRMLAARNG